MTNLNIAVGQYANKGQEVFALVDDRQWYVLANFRESFLRSIEPGMEADVYLLSYPSMRFHGRVQGIGWALYQENGASVGVLPAIEPSLNWVRLAQRFPALWLVVFFVIVTGSAYFVLGGSRVSYTVMQVAVTYMFVTVAVAPTTDVGLALWRACGNFVGAVVMLATFRLVAPDYAGRQLIARLGDLLGDVLGLLPVAGAPPLPIPRTLALHRDIGFSVADILRLVAETRLEGRHAGIEPAAAVEAAGLAQRIGYRAVAICRGRSLADTPPLPPALRDVLAEVEAAVGAHLEILRRMLVARDTMARPGSRAHRRACAAARGVAACTRPDLGSRLQALVAGLDTARFEVLADWPPAPIGALFGEVEHLRRIVDLLPALDAQLVHLCLPDAPA